MQSALRVGFGVGCAVVLGGAVGSACSLFTDLGGLAGGANLVDGSLSETGGDGASPDGGVNARFCEKLDGSQVLCEDFDEPAFGAGWKPTVDDAGSLRVDDASSASPPNSLRTSMAAVTSPCQYAYDALEVDRPYTSRVRVELDLRVGDLAGTGGFPNDFASTSVGIRGSGSTSLCYYYFRLAPLSAKLIAEPDIDSSKAVTYPMTRAIPMGQWTHVALVFDTAMGATPTVTVSLDGVTALDHQPITPPLCGFGALASVAPGLLCVSNVPGVELRTDNIVAWTN